MWKIFLALQCGQMREKVKRLKKEKAGKRALPRQAVCVRSGGPVDGSCWMGALERWPGSLRTGYEGKGMLLLHVWPPDPLSNVCLGSFETQHIYLRLSEERGRSGCQNKVIVLLTASSAVEGRLWQAHNVAASDSPGQRTVICGHAGNLPSIPLSQAPSIRQNHFFGPVRHVFFLSQSVAQWCQLGNMWELSAEAEQKEAHLKTSIWILNIQFCFSEAFERFVWNKSNKIISLTDALFNWCLHFKHLLRLVQSDLMSQLSSKNKET